MASPVNDMNLVAILWLISRAHFPLYSLKGSPEALVHCSGCLYSVSISHLKKWLFPVTSVMLRTKQNGKEICFSHLWVTGQLVLLKSSQYLAHTTSEFDVIEG